MTYGTGDAVMDTVIHGSLILIRADVSRLGVTTPESRSDG